MYFVLHYVLLQVMSTLYVLRVMQAVRSTYHILDLDFGLLWRLAIVI